jgi:predicted DNA-binding WGR domain protein
MTMQVIAAVAEFERDMLIERHDNKDNMHRFYQMFVTPGLFDDWSLIKE